MERSRRGSILEAHGLQYAPLERKRAFWRRYNVACRRTFATSVGELIEKTVMESLERSSRRLAALAESWESVVPHEYRTRTCVDSFRAGRLRVLVDSSGAKYVLSRRLGAALVAAMNEHLGREMVQRIDYRVGLPQYDGRRATGADRNREDKPTDGPSSTCLAC